MLAVEMSLQLLAIALGAGLISVGNALEPCGSNEVYNSCGPKSQPTCNNYEEAQEVQNDGVKCKRGCFCLDGYVRDNGSCIPKSYCPTECPVNSEFSTSGGIVITCQRPRAVVSSNPGCYCNEGFVLNNDTNTCIPWQECPCSGQNQVYSDRVPKYPKTCNHRSNNINHTLFLHDWKECICKPGCVEDDNRVCIPVNECPPTICEVNCAKKDNEIYVANVNEIRCDGAVLPNPCKKGCQCVKGYARDQSGSCIPLEECPCPANSTFALSVPVCPETCSVNAIRCMAIKQAGCKCNEGFVENSNRECVLLEDCTDNDYNCPVGQEYIASGTAYFCDRNPADVTSTCICSNNWWYDDYSQSCVNPSNCSCPDTMVYLESGTLDYCGLRTEVLQNQCGCSDGESFNIITGKCIPTSLCPKINSTQCTEGQTPVALHYQHYCNHPSELIFNKCGCPDDQWYDEYTVSCVNPGNCTCPCTMVHSESGTMDYCGLGKEVIQNKCSCPDGTGYDINIKECVPNTNCSAGKLPKCPSGQVYFAITYQQYCNQPSKLIYNTCGCPIWKWYDEYTGSCVSAGNCSCPSSMVYDKTGLLDYCGLGKELIRNKCSCPDGQSFDISVGECVAKSECSKSSFPTCSAGQSYFAFRYQNYCNQQSKILINTCACPLDLWYDEYANVCVRPGNCSCPDTMIYSDSSLLDYCGLGIEAIGNKCSCPDGMSYDISLGICVPSENCSKNLFPSCPTRQTYFAVNYQNYCNQPSKLLFNSCGCPIGKWYDEYTSTCVSPGNCTCPESMVYIESGLTSYCALGTEYVRNQCVCPSGQSFDLASGKCVVEKKCPITEPPCCPLDQEYFAIKYQLYCNQPPQFLHNSCACSGGYWYDEFSQSCVPPGNCSCPKSMIFAEDGMLDYCGLGKEKIKNKCECPSEMSYDISIGLCVAAEKCSKNTMPSCPRSQTYFAMTYQKYCHQPPKFTFNGCGCPIGQWFDEYTQSCVFPGNCTCPPTMVYYTSGTLQYCGLGVENISNTCGCPKGKSYDLTLGICVPIQQCNNSGQHECPEGKNLVAMTYQAYCNKPGEFVFNDCGCPSSQVYEEGTQTCIDPKMCPLVPAPKVCPDNMVFTTEGRLYYCGNRRSVLRINDCICPPGYRYDRFKSSCVLPKDCSFLNQELNCRKQDPSKTYYDCKSTSCMPTCENQYPRYCANECFSGCYCKPGFMQVSEGNKTCVLPSECPTEVECGPNSSPTAECLPSKRCDNMYLNFAQALCDGVTRCVCDPGYVLNNQQECVTPADCKPEEIICPEYMEYRKCEKCRKFCKNSDPVCSQKCEPGCFCMDGYTRNSYNVCVPIEKCPDKCPENEEFKSCMSLNPDTCANFLVNHKPGSLKKEKCISGCECKFGYVRNDNNICVTPSQCMPLEFKCDANMYYSLGPSSTNYCDSLTTGNYVLSEGCNCNYGYFFDRVTGDCVNSTMCTNSPQNMNCKSKDPNSEYSTCPLCPRTCGMRNPICKQMCSPGCECMPGFILSHRNGLCIPESHCPIIDPILCSENSTFQSCVSNQKCNKIMNQFIPEVCTAGCDCLEGYLEDNNGNCVLPEDCEKQCEQLDPNSQWEACGGCHSTCANPTPACIRMCQPGCYCKDGFILDKTDGTCIPTSECPDEQSIMCPPNSVPTKCKSICPARCPSRFKRLFVCPRNFPCQIGCECIEGYVENVNGLCVNPSTCPVLCDGNLEYSEVPSGVETCDNYYSTIIAPIPISNCICTDGKVYDNSTAKCVDPETCPNAISCGKHKVFREINTCHRTCSTYFSTQKYMCVRPTEKGCDCMDGYILNSFQQCVLPENCGYKHCPKKQQFEITNRPRTCEDLTVPYLETVEDCFCSPGYVFDDNGECILEENCIAECPEGLEYSEVPEDVQTCDGYYSIEILPGSTSNCICPEGTIYDNSTSTCVDPSNCPNAISCDKNMVYRAFNTCHRTCSTYFKDQNYMCMRPTQRGCDCIDGYILNTVGKCVLPEDCDSCPQDQIYENSDRPRTCEDLGVPNLQTVEDCFCAPGYVVDANDECTLEENCFLTTTIPTFATTHDCPTNQTYQDCPMCVRECNNYYLNINIDKCVCRPGCGCTEGYIQNANRACVLIEDCTEEEIICPNDQQYCNHAVRKTCGDLEGNGFTSGCFCNYDYVYDEHIGICVDSSECSQSEENE